MNKIKTSYKRTDEFKYCFKLYLENGDKHHSDLYTFDGITEMKKKLEADNAVFTISIQNADDSVEEVYLS
jgi:hypothetical protein